MTLANLNIFRGFIALILAALAAALTFAYTPEPGAVWGFRVLVVGLWGAAVFVLPFEQWFAMLHRER